MKITTILPLLAAGAATVLVVAGLSNAASSAVPVNTGEPTISGTAQEGETLTATSGTWTSASTISYAYQWRRCNAQGNGCSNIGGADTSSYLVRGGGVGGTPRGRGTPEKAHRPAPPPSNPTHVVQAESATPPPPLVKRCPGLRTVQRARRRQGEERYAAAHFSQRLPGRRHRHARHRQRHLAGAARDRRSDRLAVGHFTVHCRRHRPLPRLGVQRSFHRRRTR